MPNPTQPMKVTFTNIAPEDAEWTAGINLLNNWTEPERYLRHIVQYIRSGKHYPADMHVDLIKQIMEADRNAAIRKAQDKAIEKAHTPCECGKDHYGALVRSVQGGITTYCPFSKIILQSQPNAKEDSDE